MKTVKICLLGLPWKAGGFHCWGHEFDPWLGSYDPTYFSVKKPKHKTETYCKKKKKSIKL